MAKKPWIIGGLLGCCGVIFILIGAVLPLVVDRLMREEIKTATVLTDHSLWKLWGKIPGDTKDVMLHEYSFFNVENPDEVLYQGAVPVITEMNGYIYQEYDTFIDMEYTSYEGTDKAWIHFFNYMRCDNSPNCVWRNNTHPSDKVMQISAGPWGVWWQAKTSPPETLALSALYQIALGLNNDLALGAYTQGVSSLFTTYKGAQTYIYKPAGISPEVGYELWHDSRFGMGNWVTLQTWIMALQENLVDKKFQFPSTCVQGSLYVLWQYFGLSEQQFQSIFSGQFKTAYDTIITVFYQEYGCSPTEDGDILCDSSYLAALQWSSSQITLEPPLGAPSQGPSIVSSNSSTPGFPEINYFINYTPIGQKYPGVSFTVDDYNKLFFYDKITGWPKWSNYTLLDVGHIQLFFYEGRKGEFAQMAQDFNLTSVNHARVLWDYVNAIVAYTALQNRTDQNVYNYQGRGIASEASLGTFGSQTMYQLWMQLSELIPIGISSTYNYIRLVFEEGLTCDQIIEDILPGESSICDIPELSWSNDTETMALWVLTYWDGVHSEYGLMFQNLTGLSDSEMETLFSAQSTLVSNFSMFDGEIKSHYECTNTGPRCFGWDLSAKQWGRGFVTENLPSNFAMLGLSNTSSIYYLNKNVQELLPSPPEYHAYAVRFNLNTTELSDQQINNALTFDRLLGSSTLQSFFIMDFEQNYTGMQSEYLMDEPVDLLNYVRYAIDKFAFGGIFRAKSVETLLWTDYDPLLATIKATNPLMGGQPNVDPTQIQFGQNQTREQYEYTPLTYRHALNTGATKLDEVRWYRLYNGAPYINILQPVYYGESPWGSVIEWANINPWKEIVPIQGGDTWNFQPFLTKDSKITFYLDQASLIFEGQYVDETTHRGFKCLRFNINKKTLFNVTQNPAQDTFFQYGPTGLVNQSSVMGAPLFGSKPYFLDGDPMLGELVIYTRPELNVPSNYESYLNLEPYSGACFYIIEQLMYSAELKPDALYPNLGRQSLENYGYKTYMPMFYMAKTEEFDQHIVDKYFGAIKTALMIMNLAEIVGFTVGGVFFAALGLYILKRKINARRIAKGWKSEAENGVSLMNP